MKVNHTQLLMLEQSLIRVPVEQLKKLFRNKQKIIEREITLITSKIQDANPSQILDLEARLRALLVKVKAINQLETDCLNNLNIRVDSLKNFLQIESCESEQFESWSKSRLHQLVCDFLARQGFNETATQLAKETNISSLVELDIFKQSQQIETSLSKHSCTEALQWCLENKSSLKKLKSDLEFQLRLQEYIELVRERNVPKAILYMKKHLIPWAATHLKEIQQASGLLAFSPTTQCNHYKTLFDVKRWGKIFSWFKKDFLQLNSLTKEPMLVLALQAGLTALKTHSCFTESSKNINCPCCNSSTFGVIAEDLPYGHHVNSSLVCYISGKIIDESNPPYVLPNGYCYSLKAMQEMQELDGIVTCPRSHDKFDISEARKAYIS